jgi:phosphoribosylglycinamide formyltransferase-1
VAGLKIAVMISGRGSNLQALIEACAVPGHPAEIALVVSNNPQAEGLGRAAAAGIAARVINHRDFDAREAFEEVVDASLAEAGAELVCLAGFMRLLTEGFATRWRDRLINIHPSLLPAFKGINVHERVIATGVRFSGCTVHFVRPTMDDGPIIGQSAVPVLPDDTAERLAARVVATEHVCYPLAVRLIAEGRVRVRNELVLIDGANAAQGFMINPALE